MVQAREAANVFVLCDDPKAVETPPHAHLKVLKGDRSSFLSLTNNVGTSTNSLVVILWGHGGTQGNKPVFHVRGPRLTPADLLELASRTHPAESSWVLLFRGSGAFGRELAAEGRTVISSDCETRFDSDPIAMESLLGLLRNQPGIETMALAQELGRRTSRLVLRTEPGSNGGAHTMGTEPETSTFGRRI